ncbi:MAG: hypothetical protein ACXVLT_05655 [Flavisolibacter sp.]
MIEPATVPFSNSKKTGVLSKRQPEVNDNVLRELCEKTLVDMKKYAIGRGLVPEKFMSSKSWWHELPHSFLKAFL